jgi:uncharacterized protein (TIGR00251 family)
LGWPCLQTLVAPQSGCQLLLAVSPNARRTAADGLHDGCLRVRLNAPPVDGKANDALLTWLARELGLAKRSVTLLRGESARRKTVHVDAPAETVAQWLAQVLAQASPTMAPENPAGGGPKLKACTSDKKPT